MFSISLTSGSLAHRFRVAAALLAAIAVVLTALSSWWFISQQQARASLALVQNDADYNATLVKSILDAIHARMTEVAESSIIASGLVDSAGKEIYLTPYLRGIQRINGIPVHILFTDFEGKAIAENHYDKGQFNQTHIDWLKQRLESGAESAIIVPGPQGPEVMAVKLLIYSRTKTPEGALLYKFSLRDVEPHMAAKLLWHGKPLPQHNSSDTVVTKQVNVPAVFQPLGFQVMASDALHPGFRITPQYVVIFLIAGGLAVIVLLIGSRFALVLTGDLRRLETFSSSVVEHGFGTRRAEVSGSIEVASLARSINHMLDRLFEQHNQLHEESRKLKQLANTIPQLAWIADPDGAVHWYNDRWYQYTGTTPEQMQGAGWERVYDPESLPWIIERWNAAITSGQAFELTFPIRAANGKFRTFFTSVAPLRDAAGNIVQWFGTNTDVTQLEEAEKAVRESADRLREGLKAGRMVVWDWNFLTDDMRVSDNAVDVFGVNPVKGSTFWDMVHPEDELSLRKAFDHAIAHHAQCENVIRMLHAENQFMIWVEVRGTVICDHAGNPYLMRGISLDVTERKRAEEELRAADRRKDEFLAMLAHELRNPLAPISTAAQILKLVKVEDTRILKMSEIIARQVEHMTGLVDDLLDVSRVTRGLITLDKVPLVLTEVITDAIEQVKPLMDAKSHHLTVHMPAEPVRVMGDQTRLVQVITNILNNAGKYTPDGGEIQLDTTVRDGQVILSIRDNGAGIPVELLPHIFDLFTQAERTPDRSQGGLGLGLALVKSLAELHGGKVMAFSEGPGKGSKFIVCLPLMEDVGAAGESRNQTALKSAPQQKLRLLIVDDNVDAADSLALLLEDDGHSVMVEYDAASALARARREAPEVLVLDIGLPDMDGYELARQMRLLPQTADSVIIALTGYGHDHDRERSRAAGFDYHFLKPVDFAVLTALLGTVTSPAKNFADSAARE